MCMLMTVPVSLHAAKNGSHSPVWMLGSPSSEGLSEKATACDPLPAQRRTSSAASAGSHSGTRVSGISRPYPSPAPHSSIIQSL